MVTCKHCERPIFKVHRWLHADGDPWCNLRAEPADAECKCLFHHSEVEGGQA